LAEPLASHSPILPKLNLGVQPAGASVLVQIPIFFETENPLEHDEFVRGLLLTTFKEEVRSRVERGVQSA